MRGRSNIIKLYWRRVRISLTPTAILIITEGQFQAFQQFSSSKLVLKAVESFLVAINYYKNGSRIQLMYKYVIVPCQHDLPFGLYEGEGGWNGGGSITYAMTFVQNLNA